MSVEPTNEPESTIVSASTAQTAEGDFTLDPAPQMALNITATAPNWEISKMFNRHTRIRANITKTSTGKLGYECTVEMEGDEDSVYLREHVVAVLASLRIDLEAEIAREA